MKYRVVSYFEDLQDENRAYNVGDTYPRKGLKVSNARITELKGSSNLQRKPLIEDISDAKDYETGGYDY